MTFSQRLIESEARFNKVMVVKWSFLNILINRPATERYMFASVW